MISTSSYTNSDHITKFEIIQEILVLSDELDCNAFSTTGPIETCYAFSYAFDS
jgi:hypothetical protein